VIALNFKICCSGKFVRYMLLCNKIIAFFLFNRRANFCYLNRKKLMKTVNIEQTKRLLLTWIMLRMVQSSARNQALTILTLRNLILWSQALWVSISLSYLLPNISWSLLFFLNQTWRKLENCMIVFFYLINFCPITIHIAWGKRS